MVSGGMDAPDDTNAFLSHNSSDVLFDNEH